MYNKNTTIIYKFNISLYAGAWNSKHMYFCYKVKHVKKWLNKSAGDEFVTELNYWVQM